MRVISSKSVKAISFNLPIYKGPNGSTTGKIQIKLTKLQETHII